MKTSLSLALVAICALQVATANAGNPKPTNNSAANSKTSTTDQANQTIQGYMLVPVYANAQPGGSTMDQGQSYSPPYPTTGINLGQGKGSIDPGYFGGTANPPVNITHGGNPPRAPSHPTNYNTCRNNNSCNNGWYYYNNRCYSNWRQPTYGTQVWYTVDYDDDGDDDNSGCDSYDNGGSYDNDSFDGGGDDGGDEGW